MDEATNSLWEQVIADARLLTLPAVYLRLRAVLDDPDYSVSDVGEAIGTDPAIAARLLRQANSPYFGFAAKVETIPRALGLLGSQRVHDLVLATSVAQTFAGISIEVMDMHAFWTRSVCCALAAQLLAVQCRRPDSERLFLAGLLHDIGHLVMYQSIPDEARAALLRARESGRPLHAVEREMIGFDAARLGGTLLQQWGLPAGLWEPVRWQVTPEQAAGHAPEAALLHIAAVLGDAGTDGDDALAARVQPFAWQATGLQPGDCVAIRDEVESRIDGVMYLLFPGSKTVHPGSRFALGA